MNEELIAVREILTNTMKANKELQENVKELSAINKKLVKKVQLLEAKYENDHTSS